MLSQGKSENQLYYDQGDASLAENDDEDSDDSDKEDAGDEDDQYSLCRTSSKDNMAWDHAEQNRIINTAQYRQNQQELADK